MDGLLQVVSSLMPEEEIILTTAMSALEKKPGRKQAKCDASRDADYCVGALVGEDASK